MIFCWGVKLGARAGRYDIGPNKHTFRIHFFLPFACTLWKIWRGGKKDAIRKKRKQIRIFYKSFMQFRKRNNHFCHTASPSTVSNVFCLRNVYFLVPAPTHTHTHFQARKQPTSIACQKSHPFLRSLRTHSSFFFFLHAKATHRRFSLPSHFRLCVGVWGRGV